MNDAPVRARGELVSDNYFDVLAAKPFAGELLKTGDARTSTAPVVILSHDLWRRRFASDPTVVGRLIRLGRDTYTVLGIAAPGFHGPVYPTDVWVPLAMSTSILGGDYLPRADVPLFQTVARLRDGVTAAQIDARMRGLTTYASGDGWQLTTFPANYLKFWPCTARPLHASLACSCCWRSASCSSQPPILRHSSSRVQTSAGASSPSVRRWARPGYSSFGASLPRA